MGKRVSAIAVLVAMIVAMGVAGYRSTSAPHFQRPIQLSGRLALYPSWVDSGAFLERVRGRFLSLRSQGCDHHRPGWSLTNGPGESYRTRISRLELPI